MSDEKITTQKDIKYTPDESQMMYTTMVQNNGQNITEPEKPKMDMIKMLSIGLLIWKFLK